MTATVADIVSALVSRFPSAWAEPWDRTGLVAGDASAEVSGVFVTLDLDAAAFARAEAEGCGLVLTHHPPFIDDVGDLTRPAGNAGVAWDAVSRGMAVASFHTALDRAPAGADALPAALGLDVDGPLERGVRPVDLVVAFAPPDALVALERVIQASGAGRVGSYEGCVFVARGTGSFTAGDGAMPTAGSPGARTSHDEVRIEVVADRGSGAHVADALAAAHPYEEPLITVTEGVTRRGQARLGRVCSTPGKSLGALADVVAARLDCAPRVWGDPATVVTHVAVTGGSGSSLVGDAAEAGAQAFVCGEVRYHVAQEASDAGLCIIEAGHDVTEWPLIGVLAETTREATRDMGIAVVADEPHRRWWTRSGP